MFSNGGHGSVNVVLDSLRPDDLKRVDGSDWIAKMGDWILWRTLGEACVQQWTEIG